MQLTRLNKLNTENGGYLSQFKVTTGSLGRSYPMKKVRNPEEVVNAKIIKPGSRIYVSGNAGTPQRLLAVLAADENIHDVELMGVLLLGDIDALFSEAACRRRGRNPGGYS